MGQQQQVTLPWNQASITALASAIAQGVRDVSYQANGGSYRTTFASIQEMQQLLDRMTRYVVSQGDNPPPRNVRGSVFVRR